MSLPARRRLICERLSRRIGEVVPAELGRWDEAWDIVRGPSNVFLDALTAYLEHDTPESRAAIQHAADELVRAWRRAGEVWEARGRPTSATRERANA
ncbi:MAG: hypothetical protein LAT56_17415 [Wenzhouxiangella sp.]|nr:hypothetical protein [Wenzhouxiangella sp.]